MWLDLNQRRPVLPRDPSEMCGCCVRMWVWCVCVHTQTYRRRPSEAAHVGVAHNWDLCTWEVRCRGSPWNEQKRNCGNKVVVETVKVGKPSNMGKRFWCSYEVVCQTCPYWSISQKCHAGTFLAFIGTCADGITWPVHFELKWHLVFGLARNHKTAQRKKYSRFCQWPNKELRLTQRTLSKCRNIAFMEIQPVRQTRNLLNILLCDRRRCNYCHWKLQAISQY